MLVVVPKLYRLALTHREVHVSNKEFVDTTMELDLNDLSSSGSNLVHSMTFNIF